MNDPHGNITMSICAEVAFRLLTDAELIALPWGDGLSLWDGRRKDGYPEKPSFCSERGGSEILRKVEERLEVVMREPKSTTERLRYRQMLVDKIMKHSQPNNELKSQLPWRINYLLDLTRPLIVFNGAIPLVGLRQFRSWRNLCYVVDEEILTALNIAVALKEKYSNFQKVCENSADFVGDLLRILLSWPTFLHPMDQDFVAIVNNGLADAHVHFGERFPAPLIWRAIMDDRYDLEKEENPELWGNIQHSRPHFEWLKKKYLGDRGSLFLNFNIFNHDIVKSFGIDNVFPKIRYDLLLDRIILVWGFLRHILGVAGDEKEEIYRFWHYLKGRALFTYNLRPHESGFRAFLKTKKADGQALDRNLAQASLAWMDEIKIHSMDLRLVHSGHEKTLNKLRHFYQELMEMPLGDSRKVSRRDWRFVLSLTKRGDAGDENRFGRRQETWRKERQTAFKEAVSFLLRYPAMLQEMNVALGRKRKRFHFAGIDMISSEYGYDVGCMAPVYKLLGDRPMPFLQDESHCILSQDERRLTRYFHHGEDRDHPLTTSRVSWEAIQWLGLEGRDRLGHMTFLADPAEQFDIMETWGERLDNLVWLYHAGRDRSDAPLARLRLEIENLSDKIHENNSEDGKNIAKPAANDLIVAWQWRPQEDEVQQDTVSLSVLWAYWAFTGTDGLQPGEKLANKDWETVEGEKSAKKDWETVKSLAEKSYKNRGQLESFHYPQEWRRLAQEIVLDLIFEKGVLIETCPTSNLIIGSGFLETTPGSGLVQKKLLPHLVLGSDDPSMFSTDLRVEAALFLSDRLLMKKPRLEACEELRSIVKNSLVSSHGRNHSVPPLYLKG